jgi:hypothetical protein
MLCFRYKLVLKKKKNRKRSKPIGQQAQQSHGLHALSFLSHITLDQSSKSLNEIHGSLWFDN